MLTWFLPAAVLMALVVATFLARAMMARAEAGGPAAAFDVQVYRDQLAEVERDVARGTVPEAEAERIRAEIGRRLLAADAAMRRADTTATVRTGTRWPAVAAGVVITLLAAGLYLQLGAPGYADLPRAERLARAQAELSGLPTQAELEARTSPVEGGATPSPEFATLMERLRATVAERQDDAQGFRLLARNEASLGNFRAAHVAQGRLIALLGAQATGTDYSDHAEMMILAAGGEISAEASEALRRAVQLDPQDGTATYYTGLLMAQTGRPDLALQLWDGLLRRSQPEAPWVPMLQAQLPRLAQMAGDSDYILPQPVAPLSGLALPGTEGLAGPSAEDIENAEALSDADRQDMVRGMVEGLSQRLASQGGSPTEWARLIGALAVLGETERAATIWREARDVFAGNDAALAMFAEAAQGAGLQGTPE